MFLVTGLCAQNEKQANRRPISVADRVERMAKSLELNDKQKQELTAYFTEMDEKMKKEMGSERKEMEGGKEKMEARMKEMNEKLKSILGDEKFEKWQSMRPKRGEHREGPPAQGKPVMGPNPGMTPPADFNETDVQQRPDRPKREMPSPKEQAERMTKQLNLTADQQKALEEYFTELKAKREERMKENRDSKEDRREQMQKEREAQSAQLEKIIGKDKMKELEKLREQERKNFQKQQ